MDLDSNSLESQNKEQIYLLGYTPSDLEDLTSDDEHETQRGPSGSIINPEHPYPSPNNPTTSPDQPSGLTRREKRRLRSKKDKQKRRKEGRRNPATVLKQYRKLLARHYADAQKICTDVVIETLETVKPGFKRIKEDRDVDWILVPREEGPRHTVLVDVYGRVFAIRGTPTGRYAPANFAEGLLSAMQELERARCRPNCATKYNTVTLGITYGFRKNKPLVLKDVIDEAALNKYKSDLYVQACTRHVGNFFNTWSPRLFQYYEDNLSALEKRETLERPFPKLPFMASTLNLGPQAITRPRRNYQNLPFGLRAIVPLGQFDYKKRGKLRLPEVGVEIEAAPGDIIIIPTSITQYDTDIGADETRSLLTFFTAGQMFRDIEAGNGTLQSGWDLYLTTKEMKEIEQISKG